MEIIRALVRKRIQVDCAGSQINDRCAGNANLGNDVEILSAIVAPAKIEIGRGGGGTEIGEPKDSTQCAAVVGIEGIHTVVFSRDEKNVVDALARNIQARNVERLRINVA